MYPDTLYETDGLWGWGTHWLDAERLARCDARPGDVLGVWHHTGAGVYERADEALRLRLAYCPACDAWRLAEDVDAETGS